VRAFACLGLLLLAATAHADPSPLTAADRADFAWFDGIGLPSCAGKAYVRVRWVRRGAGADALSAEDVWELDGFLVAEHEGTMTVLDGDLWPRKVPRTPAGGWTGGVQTLDLERVARQVLGRLQAMRSDPGAVEGMADLYRGIRQRFGDEAQTLAFARHCAQNGLEAEAHSMLEAARALPPDPEADLPEHATLREIAAQQMSESVVWRILRDFSDRDCTRASLLARLRGWAKSFDDDRYADRVDAALEVLPGMVAEDGRHQDLDDAALARLAPAERARELIWRLRDQGGDVARTHAGGVGIELGAQDSPARRLVALGQAAVPALIGALTDARYTRAVLFLRDPSPDRLVVARVGDFAREILDAITGRSYWKVPQDMPSMFQHYEAKHVQRRWRRWLERQPPAGTGGKK
jgi:hypothetical protein